MPKRTQRQRFLAWFKTCGGLRNPADEAVILEFAAAIDEAIETGTLTDQQLACVVRAVRCPTISVWGSATELLMSLSGKFPAASQALEELSRDRKSQVRFAALCALGPKTPSKVTDEMIRRGLQDKSFRVRWKAAEQANYLLRRDLVPEMEAALAAETHETALGDIELSLRMLRDGHWLEKEQDGSWQLTVRLPRGGITCRGVSADELRTAGLPALVEQMLEKRR